ncbi:PspC domain-containing protein [Leucobacter soli]|nr:PspC domain-containing protein [Leucobacter soli]
MNDTTPPDDGMPDSRRSEEHARGGPAAGGPATGAAPGAEQAPRTSERFFAWVRGLGIVRGRDRWFAGVAGGIAAKAGIDPLIVRGIFVVLAVLGGPGILLYLAGWLLLPDDSGRIHVEDLFRGRASAGVIVASVILGVFVFIPVLFGLLPGLFTMPWAWDVWNVGPEWLQVTFTVLWWAVIVPGLVIWFIVWASTRSHRAGGRPTGGGSAYTGPRGPGMPSTAGPAGYAGPGASTGPAAPMGSAAFAAGTSGPAEPASRPTGPSSPEGWGERSGRKVEDWATGFEQKAERWGHDFEERSREWERKAEEYARKNGIGAAHVVITLACALLAAGAVAAWGLTLAVSGETALMAGLIAAVAVLGISLIVAGIRGRTTGWIGFLSFAGVVALLLAPFSTVMPENTQFVPFGTFTERPSDTGVDSGLVMVAGNSTVDLSDLTATATPRDIEVWVLAGNVTVRLPETAPTRVRVALAAGNVRDERLDDDERRQGGIFVSRVIGSDASGLDDSAVTRVHVRLLAGNVYVEGGRVGSSPPDIEEQEQQQERTEQIERLREQIEELENAR